MITANGVDAKYLRLQVSLGCFPLKTQNLSDKISGLSDETCSSSVIIWPKLQEKKWWGCQSKCPVFFPAWTLNPSMLVNGVQDKGHQSRVVRRKLRSPLRENASFRFGFETLKLQHKNTIWYQTDNTNTTWFMSLYYLFSVFLVMFGVKKGLSVLLFFCSSFRDYSMEDWVNEYWDFIKRV